jgi:tetratricopeptide (TPR) repeat protein
MIRILEAFDRGLDLDQALREVFDATPEEIDGRFLEFVRREVAELHVEPRWTRETIVRKKYSLPAEPPEDPAGRRAWAEDLTTVAWGHWQAGGVVDTEEALRRLGQAGLEPPRALFLRGEMALSKKRKERARELYREALAAGGEDYRARMALGTLALQEEDYEQAEEQFLAAEAAFPGYPEKSFNAELHLAQVYAFTDRVDDMQRVSERWLRWNADDYPTRVRVAAWHASQGRFAQAEKLYREANEVDPFRRALHTAWGQVLVELGRQEEALREWHMAAIVPPELDLDDPGPLSDTARADLLGRSALCLAALGRNDEAARKAQEALDLDGDCEPARRALEELP